MAPTFMLIKYDKTIKLNGKRLNSGCFYSTPLCFFILLFHLWYSISNMRLFKASVL